MPEGHTVHRTANQFNEYFAGKALAVSSPQGRFSSGAKLVDGVRLEKAWAVGKQMLLDFENELTIRIHLGIYGKWSFVKLEGAVPEPVGQVRARFASGEWLVDLRGPTVCDVAPSAEAHETLKRLGPDPLNLDPTGEERNRFVANVQASRKPIGLLLMEQSVISGVGNVYRAELLFRAGIDPQRPGQSVPREMVEAIWQDAVKLMKVGEATGIMITRDELLAELPEKSECYFVYKREGLPCRVCGSDIRIGLMATRKLYWCPKCQSA